MDKIKSSGESEKRKLYLKELENILVNSRQNNQNVLSEVQFDICEEILIKLEEIRNK